ncbi:MAG: LA2681 family HEPN domain-containing protein [Gemmatimonadales bacterium]
MNTPDDHQRAFQELAGPAYEALRESPVRAIAIARTLVAIPPLTEADTVVLKAGILVDAGGDLGDLKVVEEGAGLLREVLTVTPARQDATYSLGNALSVLADVRSFDGPEWYLKTGAMRREARALFEVVAQSDAPADLRARAITNRGNLLWESHRWVEAYECYRAAAELDPTNTVASSGAARLLLYAAEKGLGPATTLTGLARGYIELARRSYRDDPDLPRDLRRLIAKLPPASALVPWSPKLQNADVYTAFVARNHLALGLTLDGLEPSLRRWDNLMVDSISKDFEVRLDEGDSGVPTLFAMFNLLKADFLSARYVVHLALNDPPQETAQYADTLDYARYGVKTGLLLLGQRAAIDILDKVAVAVTEYLKLPGNSDSIQFTRRWLRPDKKSGKPAVPLAWQREVAAEIGAGNVYLIALAELAEDIARGGALATHQQSRSLATHGFVVMHDERVEPSAKSPHVTHRDLAECEEQAIRSLRVARAAIIYLEMVIRTHESNRPSRRFVVPMVVPNHHYIRGEED